MAEKTRMKVCGLEFTREPSWLDRQALRAHIDSILLIRFLGTRIHPMPCVKVGGQ